MLRISLDCIPTIRMSAVGSAAPDKAAASSARAASSASSAASEAAAFASALAAFKQLANSARAAGSVLAASSMAWVGGWVEVKGGGGGVVFKVLGVGAGFVG